ncbi:hypothetical protein KBC04_00885 [Candidatus Babeliales bacterium]|nr:hypothetical protein [Candidatus Babeliales bacterium]MBP9843710.1 hypothetical protein [Candidatus Babeliales bacterium]
MSSTLISKLIDFEFIINDNIYLSGSSLGFKEEIYNNFWQISFDEGLIQKINLKNLNNFLDTLLTKRSEQIGEISSTSVATFYLWFDEQSSQLCFNLLSGKNIELPFGCTLHVVDNPDFIFNKCIQGLRHPALSFDNIEIIERGDPRWDDEEDDFDPKKYVLDIYVTTLGGK